MSVLLPGTTAASPLWQEVLGLEAGEATVLEDVFSSTIAPSASETTARKAETGPELEQDNGPVNSEWLRDGEWEAQLENVGSIRLRFLKTKLLRQVNDGPIRRLSLDWHGDVLRVPQTGEAYRVERRDRGFALRSLERTTPDLVLAPAKGFVQTATPGEAPPPPEPMSFASLDGPRTAPDAPGAAQAGEGDRLVRPPPARAAATGPRRQGTTPPRDADGATAPDPSRQSAVQLALQSALEQEPAVPAETIVSERARMAEAGVLFAGVPVYSGPDRRHATVATVESLDLVEVERYGDTERGELWVRLTSAAGIEGYVSGEDFRFFTSEMVEGRCRVALPEVTWDNACTLHNRLGVAPSGDIRALVSLSAIWDQHPPFVIQFLNGAYLDGSGQRFIWRDERCLVSENGNGEICFPEDMSMRLSAPDPLPAGRYFTTTGLNLRVGPGTGFDPLRVLDRGQAVEVLGAATRIGETPWHRVRDEAGVEGFVSARFLSDAPPSDPNSTPAPEADGNDDAVTRYLTRNSNVRAGPGTSSDVLGVADRGDAVRTLGERRDADGDLWIKVALADGRLTGFVFSGLLAASPPAEPELAEYRFLQKTSNLRTGPGTTFEVHSVGQRGSRLRVLGNARDDDGDLWIRVAAPDDGQPVFVFSGLLDSRAPAAAAPAPAPAPPQSSPRAARPDVQHRVYLCRGWFWMGGSKQTFVRRIRAAGVVQAEMAARRAAISALQMLRCI